MTQELIVEQPCRLILDCPESIARPGPASLELLKYLFSVKGKSVLDLQSGSGLFAVAAAKLGARSVLAVDDRPDALDLVRSNARRNGVTLDAAWADGLESLADRVFDLVIAVPAQIPAPPGVRGPCFGGEDGLRHFEWLIPESFDRLEKGGQLLTSLSSLADRSRFEKLLSERFRYRELPAVEETLDLDELRALHPKLLETLEERRTKGLSQFEVTGSRLAIMVRPYFAMRL